MIQTITIWLKIGKAKKIDNKPDPALIITSETEGVTFTKADGTTGNPNNLETGDILIYGDYEYHYNQKYYSNPFGEGWSDDTELDGWGICLVDKTKQSYGKICRTIYGKDLKSMEFLFCRTSITESPEIPNTVISLGSTYQWCNELKKAPTIPESVQYINYTFSSCSNLTGNIEINALKIIEYNNFIESTKPITLTGTSSILPILAAEYDNVTIASP